MHPRVVILGGGFGGLEAAKAAARGPVDVTVVDRQNHHCFQPLLYQVATAALSPADVAWPIRTVLRKWRNVRVIMAEVTGVDIDAKLVHTATISLGYDYLVVATGATHSYFGHPEWSDVAPGLKRIEDATAIRRSILLAFERAEVTADESQRERLLTFVVVGGGPTGVEMAGAIAEVARQALPSDFRAIDPGSARIVLVEAGPRVLPSFDSQLSAYAQRTLTDMGVEVLTNTRVTGCDRDGVQLANDRIPAATIVWAAGVVASPAATWIDAGRDKAGRIKVTPYLTVPGHPEIFAIGDTALVMDDDGHPVPGLAPAAKQMGGYAGRAIVADVTGSTSPAAFDYRHCGDLATIGRRAAVVELGKLRLTGFLGWLFWSVIHIYFLIGVRNRIVVALTWLWSYVTYERGARLITMEQTNEEQWPSVDPRKASTSTS